MSDSTYALTELRQLLDHEASERHELEGEVIGIAVKLDELQRLQREMSARMDRLAEKTFTKLDRLMEHLGVPFEEKKA